MSEKLRQLLKDFIYYGKAGHVARAMEIAREIELLAEREAKAGKADAGPVLIG